MTIISANGLNYQAFFIAEFSKFLIEAKAAEKTRKNYCSDLEYFLIWIDKSIYFDNLPPHFSPIHYLLHMKNGDIEAFKDCMVANGIPTATINRRLSSLRSFFAFCISKSWIITAPTESLKNVISSIQKEENVPHAAADFCRHLEHQGASKSTIRNYLSDIKQFVEWAAKNPQ